MTNLTTEQVKEMLKKIEIKLRELRRQSVILYDQKEAIKKLCPHKNSDGFKGDWYCSDCGLSREMKY